MGHHVRVRPVRLRGYSAKLDCDTSRVIGYRAECSCGWKGKGKSRYGAARWEGNSHRWPVVA